MLYDVIVVGGSFAGLSAAMQLGRARRRVLVIDAGLPRNRFADASHGFFGQDGKPPHAIIAEAARQVLAYPTVEVVQAEASDVTAQDDAFVVPHGAGRSARGRRVILATGVSDRLPDIPGLRERWGASVLHCPYCHGYETRDRPLGVLATREASLHVAAMLPDWGATTLFTQGLHHPDAELAALLARRGVTIEETPVVEVFGQEPALAGVRLADGREIGVNALFVAPDTRPSAPFAERLGCAIDEGPLGPVVRVDDWKATTVPGVFAAGDAARANHNATLASADGVLAGVAAHRSLVFG